MKVDLNGKVALVTGGGQGIGKEIALLFAQNGCTVCIGDVNLEIANKTVEEIKQNGGKAAAYTLDVSNAADVDAVVNKIIDNWKTIDILVNNAGITRDNLVVRMDEAAWDKVLDINLKGTFLCAKAVARPMMKQRSGKIVNIASIVGVRGNAGQANYSASKGGVIALTKTLAKELGSRNITVNAVAPGFIDTHMTQVLSDDVKATLTQTIPLRRLGSAQDVANACLFLASSAADYITADVLHVDGGIII